MAKCNQWLSGSLAKCKNWPIVSATVELGMTGQRITGQSPHDWLERGSARIFILIKYIIYIQNRYTFI